MNAYPQESAECTNDKITNCRRYVLAKKTKLEWQTPHAMAITAL